MRDMSVYGSFLFEEILNNIDIEEINFNHNFLHTPGNVNLSISQRENSKDVYLLFELSFFLILPSALCLQILILKVK